VGSQSGTQLAFHNVLKGESYYHAKKHLREDLILPELLSTIYPMFLMKFFSENYDFVVVTKIVSREKN
jgi:hypothetical protein